MSERSYCSQQYVSELAVRAGYYQAQAESAINAIRRYRDNPSEVNRILVERLADVDLDADLAEVMQKHQHVEV